MLSPLPRSMLFPYTTLFRSMPDDGHIRIFNCCNDAIGGLDRVLLERHVRTADDKVELCEDRIFVIHPDRKSTRLNSSHVRISYAVFCLKKKNRLLWSDYKLY